MRLSSTKAARGEQVNYAGLNPVSFADLTGLEYCAPSVGCYCDEDGNEVRADVELGITDVDFSGLYGCLITLVGLGLFEVPPAGVAVGGLGVAQCAAFLNGGDGYYGE